MKQMGILKVLVIGVTSALSMAAMAGQGERVIISDSKTMATEVSESTVRCSEVGYGARELKINIAALDGWTLFDHTNSHLNEFGEPCMTAGRCKASWAPDGFEIEDIIKGNPGTENITVNRQVIEVKEVVMISDGQQVCQRSLREELQANIRGIQFSHVRSGAEQNFPLKVCQ